MKKTDRRKRRKRHRQFRRPRDWLERVETCVAAITAFFPGRAIFWSAAGAEQAYPTGERYLLTGVGRDNGRQYEEKDIGPVILKHLVYQRVYLWRRFCHYQFYEAEIRG